MKYWLNNKGLEFGYRSIYTGPGGTSEFLLDFVWWDERRGLAPFACECEWGNTRDVTHNVVRVAEDFDKLLSFKAEMKLMLFDSYGSEDIQKDVLTEFNRYIADRGDATKGEFYLLVDVSGTIGAVWQCSMIENGKDPERAFQFLPRPELFSPEVWL